MGYEKVYAIDLPNGGEDICYNFMDLKSSAIQHAKEYGIEIYFYVYYYYDSGNMEQDWYEANPDGTITKNGKDISYDN